MFSFVHSTDSTDTLVGTTFELLVEQCLDVLQVEGLEARVGRRGHIKVRGGLPVAPSSPSLPSVPVPEPSSQGKEAEEDGININVQALELRVRNVYTGCCPALK